MPDEPKVSERKITKVFIDREICIGAASCLAVAGEAFQLDEESKAVLKPGWVNLTDEQLLQAAKACPVAAIYLMGPDRKQIYPES